jgi:hypothetical protein
MHNPRPAGMTPEEFHVRHHRLDRLLTVAMVVLLAPFFGVLIWFLFWTDYPFRLAESWRAAGAGLLVLALLLGGIGAWSLSVPVLLRAARLVCPSCGGPPEHTWIHGRIAFRVTCARCGGKLLDDADHVPPNRG